MAEPAARTRKSRLCLSPGRLVCHCRSCCIYMLKSQSLSEASLWVTPGFRSIALHGKTYGIFARSYPRDPPDAQATVHTGVLLPFA